jgi:LssY C-terminus
MSGNWMRRSLVWVASLCAFATAAAVTSNVASAQLLRSDAAPQAPNTAPTTPGASAAPATTAPTGKRRVEQDVTVSGDQSWVDTSITVQPGEHIVATVTGKMHYNDNETDSDATGLARNFKDLIRILPYNAAGRGAVIGRVGDATFAQPFLIGAKCNVISYSGGALSIGLNQMSIDTGTGSYKVHVEIYPPDSTFIAVKEVQTMPGIDPALFTKIPRRIGDKAGDPGDMVNFVIIGNEDAMKNVFQTGGWVHVDADVKATFLHGFMESMSKESYLTMPMSILYLFGRPQDYGWAHAEPIQVVMSRNHLRVWKAPFEINGQMAWVGAATHDIGFERDQRNNGLTHKIDPDIDLERNYVEKTLTSTGLVTEVEHYLPDNPLKTAKTATGGEFHSDGHVLILKLSPSAATATSTASTSH